MFGKKKTTGTATPVPQVSNKKKIEDYLTSMSFLSHFVIDKKESLVEEEIKTVREIDKVKDSYTDVIEHNASIREQGKKRLSPCDNPCLISCTI